MMFRACVFAVLLLTSFGLRGESYDPNAPQKYTVLTLSAAIIDYLFLISEDELRAVTHEKGSWAPIDYPTLTSILDRNPGISKMVPGGSGANIIKGLAQLGEQCAIVGKIGNDDKGEFYVNSMKNLGIGLFLERGNLPTGQAICLITPDANRTFRTYLGASHSLSDLPIHPEMFQEVKLFHIEGYQLVDRELVSKALQIAKNAQVKISMALANTEIVRRNKEFILEILDKYVDIVFCNEKEAKALLGLPALEACGKLASLCEVAVVTMSHKGAWVQRGAEKSFQPPMLVNVIDRTGACDLYASGFLYGYLHGDSLDKCNWLGMLLSSYVVKRIGAEIPDPIWVEIRERIQEEGAVFD